MIEFLVLIIALILGNYYYHVLLSKNIELSWYDANDLVTIDGYNVHMKVKGEGKPLVLIHGSQMNSYDWRYTIDYFATDYKVYALDMIGSGFSDKPKVKYTPEYYAQFILKVLDYYKIEKASFIGSSWGGGHIFYLSLISPERVETMVMSSPSGITHNRSLLEKLLKVNIIGELVMLLGNRSVIRKELEGMVTNQKIVTKDLVNAVFKPIYMKGGIHAVLSAYRNEEFSYVRKNMDKISQEVLILWGEDDELHTHSIMKNMVEKLPNGQLITIENAGHLPHEEEPSVFNNLAKQFLDRS